MDLITHLKETQYTVAGGSHGRYPQLPAAIRDCSYARKSRRMKGLYLGLLGQRAAQRREPRRCLGLTISASQGSESRTRSAVLPIRSLPTVDREAMRKRIVSDKFAEQGRFGVRLSGLFQIRGKFAQRQ
jgi:hypothetical protein